MVVLATEPNRVSSISRCGLCRAPTTAAFTLRVRGSFDGTYERCDGCGSLQVRNPDWMGDAYRGAFTGEDTGAVQRTIYNQMVISWLYKLLRLRRSASLLDFGGGEGLLVRLLRDIGINATFHDRYGSGAFASSFRHDGEPSVVVTSFEVWEHFLDPSESIDEIFRLAPRHVFISTLLYRGEGPDWWYLAPGHGQHVFFYTRAAMDLVAQRFGYHSYVFKGTYILFTREALVWWRRFSLNLVLTHKLRMFLLAAMPFYSSRGLDRPAD